MTEVGGPLFGLRIVKFASIDPGHHRAMLPANQSDKVAWFGGKVGNGSANPFTDCGWKAVAIEAARVAEAGCLHEPHGGIAEFHGLCPPVFRHE